MARDYGKVFTRFWSSPDVCALSDVGKLLAVYLLSCEHGNLIGCFRLPLAYVAEDLKWPVEQAKLAMYALQDSSFLVYDEKLQWVCIPKYLRWNRLEGPKQGVAAAKLFAQIPDCDDIRRPIAAALREYRDSLPNGFIESLDTPSIPLQNPIDTPSIPVTVAVTVTEAVLGADAPAKPAKRATQLSDDFTLTSKMREFAVANGVSDPEFEFRKFCEFHRSKGSLFKDWPAAFRTWAMNHRGFQSRGSPVKPMPTGYRPPKQSSLAESKI